MAVSHRGAISFGMVHIPVGLYTATQDVDIHFNQLCKEDGSRVKYKKVCAKCGKEVGSNDIVKGFEYEPGKYVLMTDDDFEKAKTPRDRAIRILHFAELSSIRPIYFEKTYHAVPEQGGEKAYELLRRAMKEEGKVAVAQTVIGTKQKLLALIPTEDGILAETLFFSAEVKSAPKEIPHPEVSDAELSMAKMLVTAMVRTFEPQTYHDEYQARLWELIRQKVEGKEIAVSQEGTETTIIDMMEALRQSLAQIGKAS